MSSGEIVGIVVGAGGLLLSILTVLATAIWIVGKISGTTETLNRTIVHLEKTIDGLKAWMQGLATTSIEHGEDIASIKARLRVKREEDDE